jgi:hypothetical protein
MKSIIFWDVMPWNLVKVYQTYGITSQKIILFIATALTTSNLAWTEGI